VIKPSQVDVVGVGLNATDTLISLPHFPASGAKVEVRSLNVLPGGQVATAMVALQRWGLQTRYVGKLGDDHAAKIHRDEFTQSDVETRITTVAECLSAQSFILVDPQGERTVLWQRDERLELKPEELDRDWIVKSRALLVDGRDTAAATKAAAWAHAAGVPVIADLDELYPNLEPLLAKVDYLIVSRDFPAKLSYKPELRNSLPEIKRRFGCQLTAATLGTDGVLAWDGTEFYHSAAYRVPTVDTTGAGDIFHAGFIYGLLQSWPLRRIMDFACAAAALNCMATGARGGIQTREKIEDLMSKGLRYPAACKLPQEK
jgi:sulfofructose kinase